MNLGLYEKAKPYFEKSLKSREAQYGVDHINYAIGLKDFGKFYILTGNYEKAEILINQVLFVLQKSKHPQSYKCFEYLGDLYILKRHASKNKDADEFFKKQAVCYFENALKIVQSVFSKESTHRSRIIQKIKKCHTPK
jgi:tetratricopeptide (TPR) repeat protein